MIEANCGLKDDRQKRGTRKGKKKKWNYEIQQRKNVLTSLLLMIMEEKKQAALIREMTS